MLVLVAGGQMRPVLAAAEVVGHMGVLVIVDLGIVTVLFTHDQAFLPPGDRRFVVQRSVELLSSPLSLVSLSLSLPESVESLSSPLSLPESEESASSPVSPSLTVAPPCTWTPGQIVLISSSSSWMVSAPMARPPPRGWPASDTYHPREMATPSSTERIPSLQGRRSVHCPAPVIFGSSPASVGGHRPGRGGHSPPTVSIASPIKASGDLNPNAIRVSRRILVLTDSTSPLDRTSVSAAWMPARCALIVLASLTNAGIRQ